MLMYLKMKKQEMTKRKRLGRKEISSQTGNSLPAERNYSSYEVHEYKHMNT